MRFELTSTPPGAEILVNGKRIDRRTPASLEILEGSTPTIDLELTGYAPATLLVTPSMLARGREQVVLRDLKPPPPPPPQKTVKVTFRADYPFDVIYGKDRTRSSGKAVHTLDLPPGETYTLLEHKRLSADVRHRTARTVIHSDRAENR